MNNNILFKSVKKANCHIHLTGSLQAKDIRFLAKAGSIDISAYEPLENHFEFNNPTIWAIAKEITSTKIGLVEAIKIILKREAGDNVVYIEITINPVGMIKRGMTESDIVNGLREGALYGMQLGLMVKFKLGVNRKDGPKSVRIVKGVYNIIPDHLKVCIDLNGNEKQFNTDDFVEEFLQLKIDGIATSIHAGEYPEQINSLRSAIRARPNRIVHGIAAVEDRAVFKELLQEKITLEISPTSNIKTKAVNPSKHHPVKKLIECNKIPILLGNDDPAFFNNSMSMELSYLTSIGIDKNKVLELNKSALMLLTQINL